RLENRARDGLASRELRAEAGHVPEVAQRSAALEVRLRGQIHRRPRLTRSTAHQLELARLHSAVPPSASVQPALRCRATGFTLPARCPLATQRASYRRAAP